MLISFIACRLIKLTSTKGSARAIVREQEIIRSADKPNERNVVLSIKKTILVHK